MSHRKGFSLIEVMVAMAMLSIVLVSLAKIGITVATRGRLNDVSAKRNAALQITAATTDQRFSASSEPRL